MYEVMQTNLRLACSCHSTDIPECEREIDDCSEGCENLFGTYTCYCPSGYILVNDNECTSEWEDKGVLTRLCPYTVYSSTIIESAQCHTYAKFNSYEDVSMSLLYCSLYVCLI